MSHESSRALAASASANRIWPVTGSTCSSAAMPCSSSTSGRRGIAASSRRPASTWIRSARPRQRSAASTALSVRASSRHAMATRRPNGAGGVSAGTSRTGRAEFEQGGAQRLARGLAHSLAWAPEHDVVGAAAPLLQRTVSATFDIDPIRGDRGGGSPRIEAGLHRFAALPLLGAEARLLLRGQDFLGGQDGLARRQARAQAD